MQVQGHGRAIGLSRRLFRFQKTTVVTLPDGFRVMPWASRVGSVDLFCEACNVSAVPLRNRRPDDKDALL
jgi:hypothetical protein